MPGRKQVLLVEVVPWWGFLIGGSVAYSAMRWGAPYLVPKSTFSAGIVSGIQASAILVWYAAVIFALLAAMVAFLQRRLPSKKP